MKNIEVVKLNEDKVIIINYEKKKFYFNCTNVFIY